jgi:hypothetical protein
VYPILKGRRAETMSEKSRFDHRIRALHRRAGLLKTEAEAIPGAMLEICGLAREGAYLPG